MYVDNWYGAYHLGHAYNVEIHRVTTVNAYRNGLSIISAKNLLVSNCSFLNTSGTPPMAGIDIEPDIAYIGPRGSCASWPFKGICNTLENVTLVDIVVRENLGPGIQVSVAHLGAGAPIDVSFLRVIVQGAALSGVNATAIEPPGNMGMGLMIGGVQPNGTLGQVSFTALSVYDTAQPGILVEDKIPSPGTSFVFNSCQFSNVARAPDVCWGGANVPLLLHESHTTPQGVGGFSFINCTVKDELKRPFLKCDSCASRGAAAEVRGNFQVSNPHGCTTALSGKQDKTLPSDLTVICVHNPMQR